MSRGSQELTVCVVSGPTLSGKSHLLNWLMGLPEYENVSLIEMDKIRHSVFGNRRLTDTEHVFKNEATLNSLKAVLVAQRPKIIFLEMGLPTEDKHQKPLVATIADAQRYIEKIEEEQDRECNLRINLRVILNYCDIKSVERRIGYRQNQINIVADTDVLNLETYLRDMSLLFEAPNVYTPLPVNTSDESEAVVQKYHQEVLAFINGNCPIDHTVWRKRMDEFKEIINQSQKLYGDRANATKIDRISNLFKNIKLLALDCDGVMTDGTTLVGTATFNSELQKMTGATGIEFARFSHRDGSAIHTLIESGVPVVMITSQKSEYVAIRGEKLFRANGSDNKKFAYFYQINDKPQCLYDYLAEQYPDITPEQVCYLGDDFGDMAIMRVVGLPIAVGDARPEVKKIALHITERAGGNEAVREVCDLIMSMRTLDKT